MGVDAAMLDALSFQLSIMKENGNGVNVVTRSLQKLEDYCSSL